MTEEEIAFTQTRDSFYMATVVERLFFIEVVAFDSNCPKHITPRYTELAIQEMVAPLRQHIAELEAKLRRQS